MLIIYSLISFAWIWMFQFFVRWHIKDRISFSRATISTATWIYIYLKNENVWPREISVWYWIEFIWLILFIFAEFVSLLCLVFNCFYLVDFIVFNYLLIDAFDNINMQSILALYFHFIFLFSYFRLIQATYIRRNWLAALI